MPDITHPMLSVILNRWVTVAASRSLSCVKERRHEVKRSESLSWDRFWCASVGTEGFKLPWRLQAYFYAAIVMKTNREIEKLRQWYLEFQKQPSGSLFLQTKTPLSTHRYFLLRNDDCAVLSPDRNWCEPTLVYGLESIFWKRQCR